MNVFNLVPLQNSLIMGLATLAVYGVVMGCLLGMLVKIVVKKR